MSIGCVPLVINLWYALVGQEINPNWHHTELIYGRAEAWHLDVYYLTTKGLLDGHRYIFIFVCIYSNFIDIGTESLDTDTFLAESLTILVTWLTAQLCPVCTQCS